MFGKGTGKDESDDIKKTVDVIRETTLFVYT